MSTTKLRLAEADDASALAAIYAPLVRDTAITFEFVEPSPDEMRQRIATTSLRLPWLVADREDSVQGFAYASRHRSRAGYAWSVEVSVYVADRVRGMGVGRALYTAMLDLLGRQGYAQAFAGIALPNGASVALHRSTGFAPIGTFRSVGYKLGAWWDVQWWQRPLANGAGAPARSPRSFPEVEPTVIDQALTNAILHCR